MTQQTSPFLEGKYGWGLGESNWNLGMDENLLKFSYMFDRNVDNIVGSLPPATNGAAYYLTTDNRFYFAVGSTYYSSPAPTWVTFTVRNTGTLHQFNGSIVNQVDSHVELDSRLDAIELTLTTLGTAAFEDVTLFTTVSDLADSSISKGAALVGRLPLQIQTVAELRATPGRFTGDRAFLSNYLAGDKKGQRYLTWVGGSSTDDGGTSFGATGGRWVSDLTSKGRIDVAFWGLPLASGFNNVEFAAIEAYMYANKVSCDVGPGIYDNGATKYPFRSGDVASATYRDYQGVGLYCSTEATFQTTSANGNDVFNFVCVKGFNIWGYPTVKAFITTTLVSGSNGTSFVHGCADMTIEANYKDLPFIDKGAGVVDGGSAFTLQANALSLLPFENITVRGSAKNVSHGVTCSSTYEYFVSYPVKSVVLDNFRVENAYRAVVISSAAPTGAPATSPHIGIVGSVLTRNCQQVLFDARGDGVKLDISIMNTLVAASLIYLASDPIVYVSKLLGAKNFDYNIHGEIRSADTWLTIGGTSMGGGITGDTARGRLHQNVKFNSVTTTVDLINSGGVDIKDNELYLTGITSGYSGIQARSSALSINGHFVIPTAYPGDAAFTVTPNTISQVIYDVALTATRAVTLPTTGNIGDRAIISRLSTATGASAVQVLGVNYAVSTWVEVTFNGTSWVKTASGAV